MRTLLVAVIVAVAAFAAGVWYTREYTPTPTPQQTEAPTQTATSTTQTPHATYKNATADVIVVTAPLAGASVGNTVTVSGTARGTWYFEASFPLEVVSATGTVLVQMPVQAQGDWMTTEFVPFSVQVSIPNYHGAATLVLKNDNPSGLLENEKSVSIPIVIQ